MKDNIKDFEINSQRWLSMEDFEGEIWKPMKGYNRPYQISNLGRVKSISYSFVRIGNGGKPYSSIRKPHIMYAHDNGKGYLWVCLDGNKSTKKYVHRLVAEYFIPNPKNKPEIDHINTIRSDNRMVNLRWVTKSENMQNPISLERNKIIQGEPVVLLNCWGEYVGEYYSAQDLADVLGVSSSVIKDVITQKRAARTVEGFTVLRKKNYDLNKNYSVLYKRGTSPYIYVPNEKMVLVFRQGRLFTVFPNIRIAADAYETNHNKISKICRDSNGNRFFTPKAVTSDTLCYYKDVSNEIQQEALVMFKGKYPPPLFNK